MILLSRWNIDKSLRDKIISVDSLPLRPLVGFWDNNYDDCDNYDEEQRCGDDDGDAGGADDADDADDLEEGQSCAVNYGDYGNADGDDHNGDDDDEQRCGGLTANRGSWMMMALVVMMTQLMMPIIMTMIIAMMMTMMIMTMMVMMMTSKGVAVWLRTGGGGCQQ